MSARAAGAAASTPNESWAAATRHRSATKSCSHFWRRSWSHSRKSEGEQERQGHKRYKGHKDTKENSGRSKTSRRRPSRRRVKGPWQAHIKGSSSDGVLASAASAQHAIGCRAAESAIPHYPNDRLGAGILAGGRGNIRVRVGIAMEQPPEGCA